jgi:hypothetical protein
MDTPRIASRTALQGFISGQLAIVLAVIIGSSGVLAYEWKHAHAAKSHHGSSAEHHYK